MSREPRPAVDVIELTLNLTLEGDGSSLWATAQHKKEDWGWGKDDPGYLDTSKGSWLITEGTILFRYYTGNCSLQLSGPNIHWSVYTDNLVEKQVREKLTAVVEGALGWPVKLIEWSEQGRQIDGAWDFDVIIDWDKAEDQYNAFHRPLKPQKAEAKKDG